jgi:hypothetical protein
MRRARDSDEAALSCASCSYTSPKRASLASSGAFSRSASSCFSSCTRAHRSLSALSTASTAGVSSAITSCSTYKKSTRGGTLSSPAAIILSNVLRGQECVRGKRDEPVKAITHVHGTHLLPAPLGPTSP